MLYFDPLSEEPCYREMKLCLGHYVVTVGVYPVFDQIKSMIIGL